MLIYAHANEANEPSIHSQSNTGVKVLFVDLSPRVVACLEVSVIVYLQHLDS